MPFFKLGEMPLKEPFAGFKAHFVHSANMTFAHWTIQAGALLPTHSHPHEQVVNVIEGEFELTIDGKTQRLGAGSWGSFHPMPCIRVELLPSVT